MIAMKNRLFVCVYLIFVLVVFGNGVKCNGLMVMIKILGTRAVAVVYELSYLQIK